jgi:peptidoglycan hydrolase FlgJ
MSQIQGISMGMEIPGQLGIGSKNNPRLSSVEKTRELASQFESLFLTQLLKEMRQTLETDTMFAGDQSDIQGGLFDYFLGNFLAQSGGIGLADFIQKQLQTDQTKVEATSNAAAPFQRVDISG